MPILPFAHANEKVIAVADIASDSAGACIALIRNNAPASIICAERSSLSYDEKSPEQTISGILALLEDACAKVVRVYSKLQNKAPVPISSVHAVIHTPLVTSQTARAEATFKTEETITETAISKLARSAIESQKELDRTRLFEAGVANVELNGYRTGKPIGKRAHKISVATLISQCEPELRAKIVDTLRKGFGVQDPVLHSDTRAILLGTHASSVQKNIHFTIDVSGESTNCIVIHKDAAAEHLVVPEGVRTILKRIGGKGVIDEKLSLMKMVSRDACTTSACEELNSSLARVELDLVKIFGEAFNKLISERRLPNDLVLIVTPDFAPWLTNFFSRIDFGQFTVTARQFSVRALSPEDMRGSVSGNLGPKVDAWFSLGTALASEAEKST